MLRSAPAADKRSAELAKPSETQYTVGAAWLQSAAVQCGENAAVSIDAGREFIQDGIRVGLPYSWVASMEGWLVGRAGGSGGGVSLSETNAVAAGE